MFFTKGQVLEAYRKTAKYTDKDPAGLDGILKKIYPTMDGAIVIKPVENGYQLVDIDNNGWEHELEGMHTIEEAKSKAFARHVRDNAQFRRQVENLFTNLESYLRPTQVEMTEQFDEVSEEVTCATY